MNEIKFWVGLPQLAEAISIKQKYFYIFFHLIEENEIPLFNPNQQISVFNGQKAVFN